MGTSTGRGKTRSLPELLKYQHLVITRRQALGYGLSDDVIYQRSRPGGRWQRLLPGVFLTVAGTPTVDQRDVAALLYGGADSALTCGSALRRHHLRDPTPGLVHVLLPARRQLRSTGFVVMHRTWRMPPLVCYEGALEWVLPARAVADAVREIKDLTQVRAVVAAAVQSRRCKVDQLSNELREGPTHGSALLRVALGEVGHGPASVPEIDLMMLIRKARLPEPTFNARLYVGAKFLAQPDAWWPEFGLAVEVDSKEWHLSPADWERTMRRRAVMTALGILVLHFTPRQISYEPQMVVSTIRLAINTRRGQELPENVRARS